MRWNPARQFRVDALGGNLCENNSESEKSFPAGISDTRQHVQQVSRLESNKRLAQILVCYNTGLCKLQIDWKTDMLTAAITPLQRIRYYSMCQHYFESH